MSADELIRKLRQQNRFVFCYRFNDEDHNLPDSHLKARLKVHFQKCLDSYFNDSPSVVNDRAPERY